MERKVLPPGSEHDSHSPSLGVQPFPWPLCPLASSKTPTTADTSCYHNGGMKWGVGEAVACLVMDGHTDAR